MFHMYHKENDKNYFPTMHIMQTIFYWLPENYKFVGMRDNPNIEIFELLCIQYHNCICTILPFYYMREHTISTSSMKKTLLNFTVDFNETIVATHEM